MKLKTKPKPGQMLTLDYDHWRGQGQNLKGARVVTVKSRKDKMCASGLSVFVTMRNVRDVQRLDARWFSEYGPKFIYEPKQ